MNAPFRRDPAAEGEDEVREALQRRLSKRGAAREMSELLGVSEPYLSSIKSGNRAVPPKVAYLLGYRRRCRWERLT